MTYFEFLAIFLAVPVVLLLIVGRGRPSSGLRWQLPLVAVVALVYTTPWDGALIANGVWSYDPARVTGLTALRVPVEELTFYVLQVVLAGLVLAGLRRWVRS